MSIPTFTPKLQRLPRPQRELWPHLAPLANLGWILHGGTAIALRLGHRDSVDFDFFSNRPLDRTAIKTNCPFLATATVIQDSGDTWTCLAPLPSGTVKLSFFGSITFGRVGLPEKTDDGICILASLDDLFALKLAVVMQRVEVKDYRDIAALIQAGQKLEDGLAGAWAIYGNEFAAMECVKALVYFKSANLATLTKPERAIIIEAVQKHRQPRFPSPLTAATIAP
jgi:hypothetical protein